MKKKDAITVRPARSIVEAARAARPDLAEHGTAYLVECGLAMLSLQPMPPKPRERMRAGGRRGADRKNKYLSNG